MSQRDSEAGSAFAPLAAASSAESSGIGNVGFFLDAGEEKSAMRIKLGVTPPAAGLRSEPAGCPESLHQPDDEGNRYAEMRGSGMT